jgi:predicted ATP-dependent endonuclease of OLD family
MKIRGISVKNYRCLRNIDVPIEDLSVLLGQNGCGKSCLLSALRLFYNTHVGVEIQDFYDQNINEDITITVHFSDLTPFEKKLFSPYLEGEGLSIEKVIKYAEPRPTQKYHGTRFINPEFESFRKASSTGLRAEYEKLRQKKEYAPFPPYQNKNEANEVLEKWELANKEKCSRNRDEGQFFGFQNVGMHRLEEHTKFIFIPAVQEAGEESEEQKGSIFEELMQVVVKSSLAANEKIGRLQEETERKYRKLIDPKKNKNLVDLERKLTEGLNYFVPDSAVSIEWIEETGIQISPPRAYVRLSEGGYMNTVDRCGHGLQRAYILALFQQLAFIQASASLKSEGESNSDERGLPSLIIGIEEPELYQHPDRQRHFSETLLELSSKGIEGVVESIQVIYSTHAPLMVDFQRFNQLRIFKKVNAEEADKPKIAKITYSTLAQNARFLEKAKELSENDIKDEALRQRLVQIMTPWMNEGFFAKLIVLVEGIKDRALVLGEALSEGHDFESMGISVIPCCGKNSLPEAISIFKSLEIPLYVVWDSDKGKRKGISANRNTLRCFGLAPQDYPCITNADFSCTETNLEATFQNEIGRQFQKIISDYCKENCIGKPSYSMENPYVVHQLINLLKSKGHQSPSLIAIIDNIVKKYQAL